jgi:hypothetical protein
MNNGKQGGSNWTPLLVAGHGEGEITLYEEDFDEVSLAFIKAELRAMVHPPGQVSQVFRHMGGQLMGLTH